MNQNEFTELCSQWYGAAEKLAAAHTLFRQSKHSLEMAKGNAWADGQVVGSNDMKRKAALYIIVEPFQDELIQVENILMSCTIEEKYLRNLVEFAIWNGVPSPETWQGLRGVIDGEYPKQR